MVKITENLFDNLEVAEGKMHYYAVNDYESTTWENAPELDKSTLIVLEPGEIPKVVDSTGKSLGDFVYKTVEESLKDGLKPMVLYTWSKKEKGELYLGDDMTIFYNSKSEGENNFTVKSSSYHGVGEFKGHLSSVDVINVKGTVVIAVYNETMPKVQVTQEHVDKIKELFTVRELKDGTTVYELGK